MSSSVRSKMAEVIKAAKRQPETVVEVKDEATPPPASQPKPQAPVKKQAKKKTTTPKKI